MESGPDLGPKFFFWVEKKVFSVFLDILGSFCFVFLENGLSSVFTFEKSSVCLVFFRVFALSLIGNIVSYTGLGSGFWTWFESEKKGFFGWKKFLLFFGFLGNFFCVFPENGSSSIFTLEKIAVCLLFFRVFTQSLISNRVSYTGLGSGFWTRFGSEKKNFFALRNFFFCWFGRILW